MVLTIECCAPFHVSLVLGLIHVFSNALVDVLPPEADSSISM